MHIIGRTIIHSQKFEKTDPWLLSPSLFPTVPHLLSLFIYGIKTTSLACVFWKLQYIISSLLDALMTSFGWDQCDKLDSRAKLNCSEMVFILKDLTAQLVFLPPTKPEQLCKGSACISDPGGLPWLNRRSATLYLLSQYPLAGPYSWSSFLV